MVLFKEGGMMVRYLEDIVIVTLESMGVAVNDLYNIAHILNHLMLKVELVLIQDAAANVNRARIKLKERGEA